MSAQKSSRRKKKAYRCETPNVFVGGIHPSLKPGDIFNYLSSFGNVEAFDMPKDHETGGWKGYAKVHLTPNDSVYWLLSQSTHQIKGHNLGVNQWIGKNQYLKNKDETTRRKLFVKFQPILTATDLYSRFVKFGEIEAVECKLDPQTRKPRHFGYIIFEKEADAESAALYGCVSTKYLKIWCEMTMPKHLMDKDIHEQIFPQQKSQNELTHNMPTEIRTSLVDIQANSLARIPLGQSQGKCPVLLQTSYILQQDDRKVNNGDKGVQDNDTFEVPPPGHNLTLDFCIDSHFMRRCKQTHSTNNEGNPQLMYDTLLSGKGIDTLNQSNLWKPTSKRYSKDARIQVNNNHKSSINMCFRLIAMRSHDSEN